jgi:hypothetical protein
MERRKFIKTAGEAAIITPVIPLITGGQLSGKTSKSVKSQQVFRSSIVAKEDSIEVTTSTLTATLKNGFLTSLKSKITGEEFITSFDMSSFTALQLLYPSSELTDISSADFGKLTLNQVSDKKAEFIIHSWHGDGVISVTSDDETGDLIIEPSAYSSRPGVLACRWNMPGIRHDLDLVAPLFQGIKLKLDDSLIRDYRWNWPMSWEAGLAILQSASGGCCIHTEDTGYRYKALKTGNKKDPFVLGFDTEAYGPIDNNLAAGGLSWRINVHKGDWHVPAERYREWLWKAYDLKREEEKRKPWIFDVKFAISWCPGEPAVLDALAKKTDPSKVLLHFPDWRTDIYDQNYPTYAASENAKNFVRKGMNMGFHIMPHCNSIDMDPSNPAYTWIRDFQYRHVETKQLQGWSWVEGKVLGVPESNQSRLENRDKNVMIKVHPGLSMWRSILGENIASAGTDLNLDSVFIDVTLVTQNLHNCLVESMTSTEGMKKLISHVGSLNNGLVVGGEGLNEITMQGLSFAQAHLFRSWQTSIDGLERAGGCDLNHFLFSKLARTIGYSGLSGATKDEELRMQIHLDHGAIPTITINSADEITNPNAAVKRLFDMANS